MPTFTLDSNIEPGDYIEACSNNDIIVLKEKIILSSSAQEIFENCTLDVEEDLFSLLKKQRGAYDYKEMYVDYLRREFNLKKFIESFGRDEIRKAIYND